MVTAAELEQERDEIIRDVKEEMMQFGEVQEIVGYDERVRLIKNFACPMANEVIVSYKIFVLLYFQIFVCYANEDMAEEAEKQVAGRMFNHRMIVTGYLSETKWAARQFERIL